MKSPHSLSEVQRSITQGWNQVAEEYAQDRTGIFGRCAIRLLEVLKPEGGSSVLDVGCGSGAITLNLLDGLGPDGFVIGADISSAMLRLGKSESEKMNLAPPFIQMDALQLALTSNSFDYITCAFSLFQFPDMEDALREMWRVLKPGGMIGLFNWGAGYFSPIALLQRDLFREYGIKPILTNPLTFKPQKLTQLLENSGYISVQLKEEQEEVWFANPEEVWAYNMDMGPFPIMLREQLTSEKQTDLLRKFIIMLEDQKTEIGISSTFHPIYAIALKGG